MRPNAHLVEVPYQTNEYGSYLSQFKLEETRKGAVNQNGRNFALNITSDSNNVTLLNTVNEGFEPGYLMKVNPSILQQSHP